MEPCMDNAPHCPSARPAVQILPPAATIIKDALVCEPRAAMKIKNGIGPKPTSPAQVNGMIPLKKTTLLICVAFQMLMPSKAPLEPSPTPPVAVVFDPRSWFPWAAPNEGNPCLHWQSSIVYCRWNHSSLNPIKLNPAPVCWRNDSMLLWYSDILLVW